FLWSFLSAAPTLSVKDIEEIKGLPFGLTGQSSLIIRSRHVQKVRFSGAAGASKQGFVQDETGIAPQGLWLELQSSGPAAWSGASVFLGQGLNVSNYNSLVIWVRAKEANERFYVTLQDASWTSVTAPQIKSRAVPERGFPKNCVVQVVM